MKLGVSERTAPCRGTPSRWRVLVLLGGLASSAPAWSADPACAEGDARQGPVRRGEQGRRGPDRQAQGRVPQARPGSARTCGRTGDAGAATAPAASAPAPAATTRARHRRTPAPPATAGTGRAARPGRIAGDARARPADPPSSRTRRSSAPSEARRPSIDLEIFFDYKSAEITPRAAAALTPLGRALSDARLAGDAFLIAGHTDAKGSADYNLALSQKRAEAVRQYLIANFGIDGAKLVATGMGSKHLKNAKEPLAAENRRVQIVNLSKDEGPKPGQR